MSPRATLDRALATACSDVPHLVRCALVLVPGAFAIVQLGGGTDDVTPLVRCAVRSLGGTSDRFAACAFVTREHHVVVQALEDPRLALVVQTTRDANFALAMSAARAAATRLARATDLAELVA